MSLLIALRARQIDEISRMTVDLDVKSVGPAPGVMTLEALNQFVTRLPSIHLAWVGFRRTEFTPTGEGDYPSQWVAYVVTGKDASSELLIIRIIEKLAEEVPGLALHAQTGRIPTESLSAENLWTGNLNSKGVILWAVSWIVPVRLGTDKTEDLLNEF